MIVVDTNIIAYYFLNSEFSENAEMVFKKDSDWAAPYLWRSEFRSIIALYFRKNLLNYEDALQTMIKAELIMKEKEYFISSEKVFEIIKDSDLSAYDSEFVSLAKELNIKLITSDKKIISSFSNIATSIQDFIK